MSDAPTITRSPRTLQLPTKPVAPTPHPDRAAVLQARQERKLAKRAAKVSTDPAAPEQAPKTKPGAKPQTAKAKAARVENETPELLATRIQTLATIRTAYPLVFDVDMPVPLAIGIDKQLMAALELSHGHAGMVIRWWVRHPLYARAVAEEGSVRYDLDGEISGPVEDEHRETARAWLAKARAAAASPVGEAGHP